MPSFPLLEGQRVENAGANTAVSRGTTITSGAAHTKGSTYTTLIASTAFDASAIWIMLDDCPAGNDFLIDIAIGAASSEVIICSNLYGGTSTGSLVYGANYFVPIKITAGTRVSARCQATGASQAIRVSALLFAQGFLPGQPLSLVTTYGDATADSGGTSIDPGGTANTKPATFTEIVASTTYPIRALIVAFGNQANAVRTSASWLVDVAIGAASSEQIIFPNIVLNASSSPDTVLPQTTPPLPVNIPAGTRLSARAQCDIIDATDRLFDVIIYGVS